MSPHWHYAMIEAVPEDLQFRPVIGNETNLTKPQAAQRLASRLDQLGTVKPGMKKLAAKWRARKGDACRSGKALVTIFACEQPCGPRIQQWLEGIAAEMGTPGQPGVDVMKVPNDWGQEKP